MGKLVCGVVNILCNFLNVLMLRVTLSPKLILSNLKYLANWAFVKVVSIALLYVSILFLHFFIQYMHS